MNHGILKKKINKYVSIYYYFYKISSSEDIWMFVISVYLKNKIYYACY